MAVAETIMQMPDAVRGHPSNFEHLESAFSELGSAVRRIESDLSSIRLGSSDDFRGEGADGFARQITEIDNEVDDLGDICLRISSIFGRHARELRVLEKEAADALARARLAWGRRQDAEQDVSSADRNIDFFERQLDSVPDGDDGSERRRIEWNLDCAQDDRNDALRRETNANQDLAQERQAWGILRQREEELVDQTGSALRSVDLESLADPSWLQKIGDWVVAGLVGISDWIDENLDLIYEVLGVLILVLSIIATFVPVLAPVLVPLVFALSLIKFSIGLELWQRGDISGWQVLGDLVAVFTAGAGTYMQLNGLGVANNAAKHGMSLLAFEKNMKTLEYLDHADLAFSVGETLFEHKDLIGSAATTLGPPLLLPGITTAKFVIDNLDRFRAPELVVCGPPRRRVLVPTGW